MASLRKGFTPVRVAALLAALLVGIYYHWQVRAAGFDIVWSQEPLKGYYNYLAQALTGGHLFLPVEPSPKLLALSNPWDPNVDNSLKLWDTAFYKGHFYLYHGIGPALMAFAPWRALTHHDLPENAGIFAFAFAGYLFALAALVGLLDLAKARNPSFLTAFMAFLALGVCQNVPFLIHRVWVYEIAIAGGYFCVSAGIFFLVSYFRAPQDRLLFAAGFFFGMAVACRPHLGLLGVLALGLIAMRARHRIGAFLVPFVFICLGICAYNYARFGNPLQFGTKYLLGNANQNEVHWRIGNLAHGFHFLLGMTPRLSPVFPWLHAAQRPPGLPPEYAYEPIVGAIWMAPFILLALLGLKSGPARQFWAFFIAGGLGIVIFIAGTGWSVQRYETDFLPLFVLAALVCAITRLPGLAVSLVVIPGIIVSLIFGFIGPYDETLQNKPARYVRIAQWFSPIAKYRPELNPSLEHTFSRPADRPAGTRDVLIDAGPGGARYELRFEQQGARPMLISQLGRFGSEPASQELPPSTGRREIHAAFDPVTQTMNVTQNGVPVLSHKVGPLVSAPSEMYYGPPTL